MNHGSKIANRGSKNVDHRCNRKSPMLKVIYRQFVVVTTHLLAVRRLTVSAGTPIGDSSTNHWLFDKLLPQLDNGNSLITTLY